MHRLTFALATILLTAFLAACGGKPWYNPDIKDRKQADLQFERDSVACEVLSGEEYPVNKRMQLQLYEKCMMDKGWLKHPGSDVPIRQ